MEKIVIIPVEADNLEYTEVIFHTLMLLLRYEITIDYDFDEEFDKRVSNYDGHIILTFENYKLVRLDSCLLNLKQ